eukprot:3757948-Prymnesium_polylepis.2
MTTQGHRRSRCNRSEQSAQSPVQHAQRCRLQSRRHACLPHSACPTLVAGSASKEFTIVHRHKAGSCVQKATEVAVAVVYRAPGHRERAFPSARSEHKSQI